MHMSITPPRDNLALRERYIGVTLNTDEFIKKLDEETDYYAILSILHYGLNRNMLEGEKTNCIDVICKYLDYAYGYNSVFAFCDRDNRNGDIRMEDNGEIRWVSYKRIQQKIAEKAFSMLCQKVWKDTYKDNQLKKAFYKPSWWDRIVCDERLLDKIIEFFSFQDNIPCKDTSDHSGILAIDFLYKLSTSAWKRNRDDMERTCTLLIKNRKHFIPILYALDELGFLAQNWRSLSLEDINLLKSLAWEINANKELETIEQLYVEGNPFAECYMVATQKIKMSGSFPQSEKEILEEYEKKAKSHAYY